MFARLEHSLMGKMATLHRDLNQILKKVEETEEKLDLQEIKEVKVPGNRPSGRSRLASTDSKIHLPPRRDKSMEASLAETTEEPMQNPHHLTKNNQGSLAAAAVVVRFCIFIHTS